MPHVIDLNSDLGEGYGPFQVGADEALFPLISSSNIACGFHGGDPEMMATSISRAKENGVAVGAHPSYPDRAGFGRRAMDATSKQIYTDVLYQIGAFTAFAKAEGLTVNHVKAHGALYNAAVRNQVIAGAIAIAVYKADPGLLLFAMPGSELAKAGKALGLRVVSEAFADRAYNLDGSLVDRRLPGAVIHDVDEVAQRMLTLVTSGTVQTIDGDTLDLNAETICIHSDTPGAVELARAVRGALDEAGIQVRAVERGS